MEGHWKAQDKRRLEKLDFILFRDRVLLVSLAILELG